MHHLGYYFKYISRTILQLRKMINFKQTSLIKQGLQLRKLDIKPTMSCFYVRQKIFITKLNFLLFLYIHPR